MIRVLQFADIVNRYDFIDTIVQRADRRQFEVGVCVRSQFTNIEEPVYEARTPRWVLNGESTQDVSTAAMQLACLLRDWKADILHAHHYEQALVGWLATRIYRRTRLVLGRHYSDAIYRLESKLKREAFLALEGLTNRAAKRIVVPSTYIREIVTKRQNVDQSKIDVIPYGFEPEKYRTLTPVIVQRLRTELGVDGCVVFGTFARLHEEKGHRFLIRAIESFRGDLPKVRFLFVGEGPERAAIEKQIDEAGLGDVIALCGWRRDGIAMMAAVDAVVQPTLQEAFSQVMAEALWLGKPLVITDVSGAPDIIGNGVNGLLVPKSDSTALAEAIIQLANDSALRSRLGAAGRDYVAENLTATKIIPHYEQAYRRAMDF
jgi:glycosyltransferase involved in cell wall biosynthesis